MRMFGESIKTRLTKKIDRSALKLKLNSLWLRKLTKRSWKRVKSQKLPFFKRISKVSLISLLRRTSTNQILNWWNCRRRSTRLRKITKKSGRLWQAPAATNMEWTQTAYLKLASKMQTV